MQSEPVKIGDGIYNQTLIEGIEPLTLTQRDLAAYKAAKDAKKQNMPLGAGTLFNQSEPPPNLTINQLDLF